jgi:hypothetical protein
MVGRQKQGKPAKGEREKEEEARQRNYYYYYKGKSIRRVLPLSPTEHELT